MCTGGIFTQCLGWSCVFFSTILCTWARKQRQKRGGVEKFLCRYYIIVDWFYSFKENLHESFFVVFFALSILDAQKIVASASGAADIILERVTVSDSHKGFMGHYTFTFRLINNPEKIDQFKAAYAAIPVVSEEMVIPQLARTSGHPFGMGEKRITKGEELLLYIDGICDCIGISVWDSVNKIACLYHASKMELREMKFLFQEGFLDNIKSFSEDLSSLEINLASCYWSKDLVEVIDLLQTQGFRISGLYVPNALLENSEFECNIYVDRGSRPSAYFVPESAVPSLAMMLNSGTGEIRIYPNWVK